MRTISNGFFILSLIVSTLIDLVPAEVTHEEIRGTIQSLIYSYNQLDNKLERHEHRERALGELLKKAMQTLQKGQKNLEPINGIFSRLDERVSQIETMLIAQEEKYNIQTEKLGEALEHIFKWMRENDECYKRPPVPASGATTNKSDQEETKILENIKEQQAKANKEILRELTQLSDNVKTLLDRSKNMMEQTEVAFKSVPSTAEMLTKIEDKLISYSVATSTSAPAVLFDNSEFEEKIMEKFVELNAGINDLRSMTKIVEGLTLDDREYIQSLNNDTLNALEQVKIEALNASDAAFASATGRIKEVEESIDNGIVKVFEGINASGDVLDKFYNEMNASYTKLNEGLDVLSKFNNILMTNSEYVLETQRKVEFGTHRVVQRISDLLDKQRNELSTMMKQRFDDIDQSIISNHMDAMQNLSSLMESEISHVWRQIEIMASEITDSKELLNTMQGKTELYVNTTFATMGSMDDKVQLITGRMIDLETNLNYLLGRLSVMSQEFALIKTGLGEALDEIRNTFHSVKDKLGTDGGNAIIGKSASGSNHKEGNEYETELNLLKGNNK